MPPIIKQKLLGIVVICLLFMAFIPVILEKPTMIMMPEAVVIPPQPDGGQPKLFNHASRKAAIEEAIMADRNPRITDQLGTAWTVRVTEASDRETAQIVRSRLVEQGFRAYIEPVDGSPKSADGSPKSADGSPKFADGSPDDSSSRYYVFVGPDLHRQDAQSHVQALSQQPEFKPEILPYYPW